MEHFFLLNELKQKLPTSFESDTSDISDSEIANIQEYFINISTNQDYLLILLQPKARKQFEDLLCFFVNFKSSLFFKKWVRNSDMESVPLEFLYRLHVNGVLLVSTVLYFHPTFGNKLCSDLISMVFGNHFKGDDLELCIKMVTTILSALINVGTHSLRKLFSLSASVLESFSAQVVENIDSGKTLTINYLDEIAKGNVAIDCQLKLYEITLLNSFLCHEPSSVTTVSAISIHYKEWTAQNTPATLRNIFSKLLLHWSVETILQEIAITIREEKLNLKYLLFIITLLCEKADNLDIVKGHADEWFKEGINAKNENVTVVALLAIRHLSALVKKYFVSYATWFGSLQIKSAPIFSFLFKLLSKIVPYEPPVFLKIQVTKVPSVPTNGQQILTDYVSLAKTRLADMKEASEYMGLFNDFHETLQEQQESDVGRVIAQYSESKEISKAVLEASVFRKHYYEKFFLQSLLSVPESSDKVRGELIKKLNKAGKIPSSLYNSWAKM